MIETLTHRRQSKELSEHVMLFAEDGNEHYGDHVWTLKSELPRASESQELIDYAAEFYGVDHEEAENLIDPENIVDTAGAWDDVDFVRNLWNEMEMSGIKTVAGYRTFDGAVVLDAENVELDYHKDEE